MKKSKERIALDIACKWLEQSGSCRHGPGFLCDKDFTTEGVCAKCLAQYFLRLAGKIERKKGFVHEENQNLS